MSNKLSLIVNFLGVDKMSGALRNIVGLGTKGSNSIRALTGESRKLERELAKVRRELSSSTGNVTELANRERDLERQLAGTNQQLRRQRDLARVNADRMAMLGKASEFRSKGVENIFAGAAMSLPLVTATKQAMTFEAAMADVRKVVDFPSPKAFAQMSDDVLALSTRIPMASEGIAAIVAAAGRAHIPRQELLGFAEDAAKMGVAFDMTGDEAGAMMAKWRTAFTMGQGDVTKLANQINALTNSYGGTAVEVSGIVTRIGALGKVAGVSAPQVAAMAQLLNSVEEEVAATGIKNMMLAMTKGDAATKSQAEAFKALGINTTTLAKRMQTDAGGAITDVLGRLSKLPKAQQAGVLTQIFGSESVSAIAPMLTNLDKLQNNLKLVGDKAQYAGSMEAEYLSAIATTEGATGLAMNALKALNITMGQQLLPTVTTASKQIVTIANSVRAWSKEHPQLSSGIVTMVTSLVALRVGLGVTQLAFGALLGPFARILPYFRRVEGISMFGRHLGVFARVAIQAGGFAVRAFGLMRTAALFLAQGVMRAGLMMMANPIVLAITLAIAVLAGAAYLVYTHWGAISGAFMKGVAWVKSSIAGLPDWLKSIGSMMMQGLLMAINPMALAWKLVDLAKNGVKAFKAYFGIKSPSRLFMAMGGHLSSGLERGIDRTRQAPVKAMGRMAEGVAATGARALSSGISAGVDRSGRASIASAGRWATTLMGGLETGLRQNRQAHLGVVRALSGEVGAVGAASFASRFQQGVARNGAEPVNAVGNVASAMSANLARSITRGGKEPSVAAGRVAAMLAASLTGTIARSGNEPSVAAERIVTTLAARLTRSIDSNGAGPVAAVVRMASRIGSDLTRTIDQGSSAPVAAMGRFASGMNLTLAQGIDRTRREPTTAMGRVATAMGSTLMRALGREKAEGSRAVGRFAAGIAPAGIATSGSAVGFQPGGLSLTPIKPAASSRPPQLQAAGDTYHVSIQQLPGENPDDLLRRLMDMMKREKAIKGRREYEDR